MSSVSGRYPASSDSANPSVMIFAATSNNSHPYGGLDGVSGRQYNDEVSERYAHHHMDTYPLGEAQRGQRLPPPQSLAAGVPWTSEPVRSHVKERSSYHAFSIHHQDDSSPLAASAVPYLASQPPFHHSEPAISHRAYPPEPAPEHPPPHQQPIPAPQGPGQCLPGPGPEASRYSRQSEPLPSQAPLHRSHQAPVLSDALPNSTPNAQQQMPGPASAIGRDGMAIPPPLRGHQANGASSGTRIPNLLGPNQAHALVGIDFGLRMRQQPNAARACGFGDRDRRVIDPPPIVQLMVQGPHLSLEQVRTYLRYDSYVMSCSIFDETGRRDSSYMPDEYQNQRRLMGSLISTPFVGQDENSQEGCFFCFSDLSCRTPGTFRLKFTLMMIDPNLAGTVKHFPILADTMSEPFKVYNAKEFPGMVASSRLAKRLKEQGCIISIKKGNERTKNLRTQDDLTDDDDDNEEGSGRGQRKRRAV